MFKIKNEEMNVLVPERECSKGTVCCEFLKPRLTIGPGLHFERIGEYSKKGILWTDPLVKSVFILFFGYLGIPLTVWSCIQMALKITFYQCLNGKTTRKDWVLIRMFVSEVFS